MERRAAAPRRPRADDVRVLRPPVDLARRRADVRRLGDRADVRRPAEPRHRRSHGVAPRWCRRDADGRLPRRPHPAPRPGGGHRHVRGRCLHPAHRQRRARARRGPRADGVDRPLAGRDLAVARHAGARRHAARVLPARCTASSTPVWTSGRRSRRWPSAGFSTTASRARCSSCRRSSCCSPSPPWCRCAATPCRRQRARERSLHLAVGSALHQGRPLRSLPGRAHHALVSRGRHLLDRRVRDLRDADGRLALPRHRAPRRAPRAHEIPPPRGGHAPLRRLLHRRPHEEHPRPLPRPRPPQGRLLREGLQDARGRMHRRVTPGGLRP